MMFCDTLPHVSVRHCFKSLVMWTAVLYTHSCINLQSWYSAGVVRYVFSSYEIWSELCCPCWNTIIYTHWVMSVSRYFRRCYLKANKVCKSGGTSKVEQARHFESVLTLFTKNYPDCFLCVENTACQSWHVWSSTPPPVFGTSYWHPNGLIYGDQSQQGIRRGEGSFL